MWAVPAAGARNSEPAAAAGSCQVRAYIKRPAGGAGAPANHRWTAVPEIHVPINDVLLIQSLIFNSRLVEVLSLVYMRITLIYQPKV